MPIDSAQRPILGFLLPPRLADKVPIEPPGAEINNLMDAVDQAGIGGYSFALRDVQPKQMAVNGWTREQGQWRFQRVPWPDVFYDQTRGVPSGLDAPVLNALYTGSTPINTARILGKYLCYNMLERYMDVRPMLPETTLFQQPDDLRAMLNRYRSVYLKPEWGSGGYGISRVWADDAASYGWAGAVSGLIEHDCTLDEAIKLIRREAGNNLLAIQQEIPLFEIEGRRSDMRIGLRKDGSGRWCFDPARTRMVKPGGIATNWLRGGAWTLFPKGLDYYVRDGVSTEQLWTRLQAASLKIALRLEESVGPMGELGFDLGFDQDLNIWFIEANPMPTRPLYDTIDGVIHPVYTRIIDYAIFLYQQRIHSAERDKGGKSGP